MATGKSIKLMLVDDHPIVREGLRAVLEQQPDMQVVAEATDGLEAVTRFRESRPDLVLMDFMMPRMNGLEALTAIRAEFPGAVVVILSSYDGEEDVYQAIRAGASGYILKEAPREELLAAIHDAYAGQKSLSEIPARRLSERIARPQLSQRERDVLRLIVDGQTNLEIGKTLFISEGTVKSHVNSILSKLDVTDRTKAAILAVRKGLIHI